jgi:hypothetical protein
MNIKNNREKEIFNFFNEWLNIINIKTNIKLIERCVFDEKGDIEKWNFFEWIHSEKNKSTKHRWYIITTTNNKKYLITFNDIKNFNNIKKFNEYEILIINESLLNNYPKIGIILKNIKNIEEKYREEKSIEKTEIDKEKHKIIDKFIKVL